MGKSPVVPESAIIDDAGRPVVFVQRGGETFLRRPVKLGIRNHGLVQVLEGVNAGDRVVTKGAYLIRLSTMSSAVPAHGHVH
jgi:multidrug efflux pump subunit AcrA (membrane-fusion protein)